MTTGAAEILKIELPAHPQLAQLLTELIYGVLSRIKELVHLPQTLDNINQAAQTLLAQSSSPAGQLAVTMAVAQNSEFFSLTINASPPLTFSLPVKPASPPQPPAAAAEPGLGVGMFLIQHLVDEVTYEPQAGNNRWRLVKLLAASPQTTPPGSAIEPIQLDLPAAHKYLNLVSLCLQTLLHSIDGLQQPDQTAYLVGLAVQEACTNIVNHAYGPASGGRIRVTLGLAAEPLRLMVELNDTAPHTFNPTALPGQPFPYFP